VDHKGKAAPEQAPDSTCGDIPRDEPGAAREPGSGAK
jgi:hypothetical protein